MGTACGDGVVRIFRLDDISSKSFKYGSLFNLSQHNYYRCIFMIAIDCIFPNLPRFLRINMPAGGHPKAVVFADNASSVVVASQTLTGASLYLYGEEKPKTTEEQKQQAKLPLPEIKWQHHKVHDKRAILTLVGTKATYGTADGSTIIASCSEGIF